MKYDAVIFDLFGTLVDNVKYLEDTGGEYCRMICDVAAALSIPMQVFRRFWSATEDERYTGLFPTMEDYLENLCRQSGIPASPDRIAHAVRIRLDYFRGLLTPRDARLPSMKG